MTKNSTHQPSMNDKWKDRYESGDTPWDTGRPESGLIQFIEKNKIIPCNALEIGCGTGTNSIWLAKKGFSVTGIDISTKAIEIATNKSKTEGVSCHFQAQDFLSEAMPEKHYSLAFDRGCFHVFDPAEERSRFAQNVAHSLAREGCWLSLIGSADDPPRDTGPPRRTAQEIVDAVEPFFEILSLTAGFFDSQKKRPPRSWVCYARKRE